MKKQLIAIAVAAAVAMSGTSAFAGGVPTIDVATIAQLAQQYAKLQEQFAQLQKLESIASGNRGMGNLLNDPKVQVVLPQDWAQMAASIKGSAAYQTEREKLGTAKTPAGNALLDKVAEQNATMTQYFTAANARLGNVAQLMQQIDLASDPAAKQDLANRLANEQNAIAASQQVLAVLKERQHQERSEANKVAARSAVCAEFKRTGC